MTRAAALAAVAAAVLVVPATGAPPPSDPAPITVHRPVLKTPHQVEFDSLSDLFPTGSTKLVNGVAIVDLSAWSAVLIARLDPGIYCSATLIGPRVLLTAAHCVDAGFGDKAATIGGRVNIGGSQFQLKSCAMHPDYVAAPRPDFDVPRMSEDYALCELDGSPNIVTETLADAAAVGKGSQMLMTGYGCYGIHVVGNELVATAADQSGSERLRLGDAVIEAAGVRDQTSQPGAYLRVRSAHGEPILCPGDSGGPAIIGASLAQQKGPLRRIIGVNSMVTAMPRQAGYDYLSFVASTSSQPFRSFAAAWTAQSPSARRICGRDLAPGEQNCRA